MLLSSSFQLHTSLQAAFHHLRRKCHPGQVPSAIVREFFMRKDFWLSWTGRIFWECRCNRDSTKECFSYFPRWWSMCQYNPHSNEQSKAKGSYYCPFFSSLQPTLLYWQNHTQSKTYWTLSAETAHSLPISPPDAPLGTISIFVYNASAQW